jgi:hypothetical protein
MRLATTIFMRLIDVSIKNNLNEFLCQRKHERFIGIIKANQMMKPTNIDPKDESIFRVMIVKYNIVHEIKEKIRCTIYEG